MLSLEDRFARFAEEADGRSPLYTALSRSLVRDAAPARALREAAPGQRRPTLWFAALHETLLENPDDALAAWYPSCGGHRSPDEPGLRAALEEAVGRHGDAIAEAVRTRRTQTNEIGRTAGLRVALSEVRRHTDRPIALVELGPSAGLLLLVDRIAHRFGDGATIGPADPAFVLDVAVRGPGRPDAIGPLGIGARAALDLDPRDPADPATASWLRACIWPEHARRRARLDLALDLARDLAGDPATSLAARMVRGDMMTDALEHLVLAQPDDHVVVVWSSSAIAYVDADDRARLATRFAALGRRRELWQAVGEGPFLPPFDRLDAEHPPERDNATWNVVGLTSWSTPTRVDRLLARTGPHGEWLRPLGG